jgi:hypothetical protein
MGMINTQYQAKTVSKQIIKFYSKRDRLFVGIDEQYFYLSDGYQATRIDLKILPLDLKRFAMQLVMKELKENVLFQITEGGISEKEMDHFKRTFEETKEFKSIVLSYES